MPTSNAGTRPAGAKKSAKPIPDGYHTVTTSLTVRGADQAIEFYKRAFGAQVRYRFDLPNGKVGHAELRLGDSPIMLGEEIPAAGSVAPDEKGSPVTVWVYTKDVDAAFDKAVQAGAQVTMPLADQFWGDRVGGLKDPFGHNWVLATHTEDVSEEEIQRRGKEFFAKAVQKGTMSK